MHLTKSLFFSKMGDAVNTFLKDVFNKAVCSVKPVNLIKSHLQYDQNEDTLKVFTDNFDIKNRDVHLIGAGKAVFQMAVEVEKVLGSRLKSGIISIPVGAKHEYLMDPNTVIKCFEGAENNIPDKKSELAAKEIKNLTENMDEECLLLVLLSGGGSALLPSPTPPVTLKEKSELIKELSKAGADILEMNTVRKKLSYLKGGKLALLAQPAEVVSLIISDIVGIKPESVASGPTFQDEDKPSGALEIVQKYSLQNSLPSSIKNILTSTEKLSSAFGESMHVSNYVLANNVSAIYVGYIEATSQGYTTFQLSETVTGEVDDVAEDYCQLVVTVIKLLSKSIDIELARAIMKVMRNIPIHDATIQDLSDIKLDDDSKGICLISGGEPTVKVKGSGKGGRCQHLALKFSLNFNLERLKNEELTKYDVYMLCAGTDGMDGPTDAAGALGYSDLLKEAAYQDLSVESYLSNNDSYNFFNNFSNGKNHIKIGHTNTNVMDIHAIVIKPKIPKS